MDITPYIREFAQKKPSPSAPYDMETVQGLLISDKHYSFEKQKMHQNSEFLAASIQESVQAYTRDKDIAIRIYKDFLAFLKKKVGIEVTVKFPPISIFNSFERLMFIAKYLQDPRHNKNELPDVLWTSETTIRDDIRRLQGDHKQPIQVCGKKFVIEDMERHGSRVQFPSTAHPLFLTPNLTQVLVTLKGLKEMSSNPLYAEYAQTAAADIWEQLSDYAKTRIDLVLSELMPEDLTWYKSLRKSRKAHFYSEVQCSGSGVVLDCIKNGKTFYVEYEGESEKCFYKHCTFIPRSYDGESIEVNSASGCVRLYLNKIIRSAYTAEELL